MNFATIKAVYDDGVTLAFDDGSESQKHYKVNSGVVFNAGDRVRILEDSGTYVVEYVVGRPIKAINAGTASTAGSANKLSTARQIRLTGDVEGTANFDGSANISISVSSLRTATLKNAHSPNDKNKDISLYAQYNNALYYRVGSNTLVKLQNG